MFRAIVLLFILSFVHNIDSQQTLLDVSTQAICTESGILAASGDSRWMQASLDTNVDWAITCGDIVAFKLEWFPAGSGKWSSWFVVGVNDVDSKSDGPSRTVKRMWSYFPDHRHIYIICKQKSIIGCSC